MGLTTHAVSLSEEKRAGRRRDRRRDRRRSEGGKASKEKSPDLDSESIMRALGRFTANPSPMGFPSDVDPPPRTINVNWELNAISRDVQKKAG